MTNIKILLSPEDKDKFINFLKGPISSLSGCYTPLKRGIKFFANDASEDELFKIIDSEATFLKINLIKV